MNVVTKGLAKALPLVLVIGLMAPALAADPPVEPYRHRDRSVTALNILPPGQGRYMNSAELTAAQADERQQPEENHNQRGMYDRMVSVAPDVTRRNLTRLFKDASFGVPADKIADRYSPRDGVTILRDRPYRVPHVYGATRADTLFGAGYASAEDRLFMMDVLRHVGRGRSSELLGASKENLAMDRAAYKDAGYSERELKAMIARLPRIHKGLGTKVVHDIENFAAGVNEYIEKARTDPSKLPGEYAALQILPENWKPTDTVAIASLIGSQLGVGGGAELRNAAFLKALARRHGYRKARAIFRDFRELDDPEAPVTTGRRFPYLTDLGPVDRRSIAMPDRPTRVARRADARPTTLTGPFGPINLEFSDAMSNALLVDGDLSATGRPLAVFGPQTGYFSPEILMEMDLHGPGIASRGVGFPGISMYTLLGRGTGYAWSATSANGDQVDIFAERLCDPGGGEATIESNHYRKDGRCVPMYRRTDQWRAKPTAAGVPQPGEDSVVVTMTTERTNDGIVQARGTVGGRPVAFVQRRVSFKREVDSALTYVLISDPSRIKGPRDFQRAFARFAFTFNWFYLDSKDIAYVLGGSYPRRTRGVTRSLPVWGGGRWRWRGRLGFRDLPKDINPERGFITSWNNKQAPRWGASDDTYSFGPVFRSQLLDARIRRAKRDGKVTLVELVNAMGDAGTADLRGDKVLPHMLKALGRLHSERLRNIKGMLARWHKSGSHRRDRNRDGQYERQAAVALMDEWWNPALDAMFKPRLGRAIHRVPQGRDDEPGPVGSAYIGGWYGYANKDLRTVLGGRVRGRYSLGYCGRGHLRWCRKALRASFKASVASLSDRFGRSPSSWDADEEKDMIRFRPIGIQGQEPMRWQNRPTFQQVLEFRPPR